MTDEPGEADLTRAADVLVDTALRIAPGERFVAIGDLSTAAVLDALESAARRAGAEVAALRLDQLRSYATHHDGLRPHKVLPDGVRRAMLSAQASVFIATAPVSEGSMRDQLLHIVGACRIRHAHLPEVTPAAFAAGLAADATAVVQTADVVLRLLEIGREVTCTSAAGTHLVVRPGARRWEARVGRIAPGESILFPTGSLVVDPESVRGRFVANASLGGSFGEMERLLRHPVSFEIEDGAVHEVRCPDAPELARDVEAMLAVTPSSSRVGGVVLGLNPGAKEPTGCAVVDQHRPGLHLVLGDPASSLTSAEQGARATVTACQSVSTVAIDGIVLIEDGRLSLA